EARAAQAQDGETCTDQVDAAAAGRVGAFGDMSNSDDCDDQRQRQVDEENESPGGSLDQITTEEWTDRRCDAAQARPGADGPRPVVMLEAGLNDCQAAGRQQRAAYAL